MRFTRVLSQRWEKKDSLHVCFALAPFLLGTIVIAGQMIGEAATRATQLLTIPSQIARTFIRGSKGLIGWIHVETATSRKGAVYPSSIHVYSCRSEVPIGQREQFTAIGLDAKGETINGLRFDWSSSNPAVAQIDETGIVTPRAIGEAEFTASAGTTKGSLHIRVTRSVSKESTLSLKRFVVLPSDRVHLANSTRKSSTAHKISRSIVPTKMATAPLYPVPLCSGDCTPPAPNNQTAPQTNVGKPNNAPLTQTQSEATIYPGSSNYNKVFPFVTLPGRGDNTVSLSASYNSQVWVYEASTNKYSYNTNWDWPGPGFNLHFAKINWQTVGGSTQYMLITPDGTRHTLVDTGSTGKLQTNDGTFILVTTPAIGPSYIAHFPDGTVVTYDVVGANNYQYASRVQDRNGNYFTISYTATVPQINFITDDQGRQIQFGYDGNGNLTSITAPNFGGGTRTVAQFGYTTINVSSSFTGAASIILNGSASNVFTVPSRLYYPQTGTGYIFTYGSYGMIAHLSQRVNMTANSDGSEIAWTDYNYPSGSLSDIPRFTQRQESWSGADVTVPVTYTYANTTNGSYNIYTVTDPLSRAVVQKTGTSGASNGLLTITEVQYPAGTALSRVTNTWGTDIGGGGPQLTRTDLLDVSANLTKHVEYSYSGTAPTYNNPTELREYGFSGEQLRRTTFSYVTNTNYTNPPVGKPRLLHLLSAQTVYNLVSSSATARTEFDYDSYNYYYSGLTVRSESGPVTGHDDTNFGVTFIYRGNPTAMRQFPDYANQPTNSIQQRTNYDMLGNVVVAQLSCCQQKLLTYVGGAGTNHFAAPTSIQSGASPTLTESYGYDPSTGLVTSYTDNNQRITNYDYFAGTLASKKVTLPTQAHQDFSYDYINVTSTVTSFDANSVQVGQQQTFLNGLGQTKTVKQWAGSTAFDRVDQQYDAVGRVSAQTNPYRDGSETQRWSYFTYDALDRTTQVTLPDSQTIQSAYSGQYIKVTDQVGRRRITQTDALGRLAQVIEVAAATSDYFGYSTFTPVAAWGTIYGYSTTYSYDALDNVTTVQQGSHTRLFVYDGLSRLLYKKEPEQGATIAYNGQNYSVKYEWDANNPNNLRRKTDSRGAVSTYFYDGLNRLVAQTYSGSPTANNFFYFWDGSTSLSIPADTYGGPFNKNISFPVGIDWANAIGRLSASVNDTNTSGDYYKYGPDGEVLTQVERVSGTDFTTVASYNSLLQTKTLQYPSGRQLDYTYDSVLRPSAITDHNSQVSYIYGVNYGSAGQITQLNMGDGTLEIFGYDANRLQLTTQQVTKSGSTLLNLGYSYAATAGQHGSGTAAGNTGQLISMSDTTPGGAGTSVNYTYDLRGRLKTGQAAAGWSVSETYDRYGNRWQQSPVGVVNSRPTSGTGTVTISGTDRTHKVYIPGEGWVWVSDYGTVTITVNGYTVSTYYNAGTTSASIASALAAALNNPSSPVTASVSGSTVTLTAKDVGTASNYSLSATSQTDPDSTFTGTSFPATPSGSTLTGGSNGSLGSGGSGPTANFAFDSGNRIVNSGYAYDNAGNLTSDGVFNYVYDGENRMTQAGTATYTYNASRQRISRTYGGGTTYYINNSGFMLSKKLPDNSWRDFIYFGSRLIVEATSSGTFYHHQDTLSTRVLTNSSGTVIEQQQPAPFGEVMTDTGYSTNFKFTSYERDGETGNDYALNRQYASNRASFNQADPYDGSYDAGSPQTFNRYGYVGNDPLNVVDPSGLAMELVGVIWIDGQFVAIYSDSGLSSPGDFGFGLNGGFGSPDTLLDTMNNKLYAAQGFSLFFASHVGDNLYNFIGFQGITSQSAGPAPGQRLSQADCDKKIASTFGGPGAVAATVNEPETLQHPSAGINRFNHLAGNGSFHLYTNAQGTAANVGLYAPAGFVGRPASGTVYQGPNDPNPGQVNYNYERFNYPGGLSISFIHVGNPGVNRNDRNAAGSVRVGNIAGPGGEGAGYNHTHVNVYQNGRRVDPRGVFCK
jgi:RHS repeat-associated protein